MLFAACVQFLLASFSNVAVSVSLSRGFLPGFTVSTGFGSSLPPEYESFREAVALHLSIVSSGACSNTNDSVI